MFFLPEENPILKLPRHSHNLAGFEACSSAGVRPPAISSFCLSSYSPLLHPPSIRWVLVVRLAEQKLVLWHQPPIGPKDS